MSIFTKCLHRPYSGYWENDKAKLETSVYNNINTWAEMWRLLILLLSTLIGVMVKRCLSYIVILQGRIWTWPGHVGPRRAIYQDIVVWWKTQEGERDKVTLPAAGAWLLHRHCGGGDLGPRPPLASAFLQLVSKSHECRASREEARSIIMDQGLSKTYWLRDAIYWFSWFAWFFVHGWLLVLPFLLVLVPILNSRSC